ncbi:MAG: PIN domain-containing protein [Methanobacteriota archaeon]|nr:PIN domain-containing protein [Candidatus Hydrothermarchaeota archaeon]
MGRKLEDLKGRNIVIDTSPFIYYIEENKKHLEILEKLFSMIDSGEMQGTASVITLLEVLVKPLKENDASLAGEYRRILTESKNLDLLDVNQKTAEKAAHLRAKYGLPPPDAIVASIAILNNSDFLLTNDEGFKKIKEIKTLLLNELKL